MKNYFKSGDYNAICDRCGFKKKASELKKTWDGFMVCPEDFEPRHSLDFLKGPHPERAIPWARPEVPDRFEVVPYDTTSGVQENDIPSGNSGNGGTL